MKKQELSPRNKRIAEAKEELEASLQWMGNVPTDAKPEEISRHQIIVQFWPDRIQRLVAERN